MAQYRFERLEGEYTRLFEGMRVVRQADADKQARAIVAHKGRYQAVEKSTGVPWHRGRLPAHARVGRPL
jgi:lysozyme family protein